MQLIIFKALQRLVRNVLLLIDDRTDTSTTSQLTQFLTFLQRPRVFRRRTSDIISTMSDLVIILLFLMVIPNSATEASGYL